MKRIWVLVDEQRGQVCAACALIEQIEDATGCKFRPAGFSPNGLTAERAKEIEAAIDASGLAAAVHVEDTEDSHAKGVDDTMRFLQINDQEVETFDDDEFAAWIAAGRPHVELEYGAWGKVLSETEKREIARREQRHRDSVAAFRAKMACNEQPATCIDSPAAAVSAVLNVLVASDIAEGSTGGCIFAVGPRKNDSSFIVTTGSGKQFRVRVSEES